MDANFLLIQLTFFSCGMILLRRKPAAPGWRQVSAIVGLVLVVTYALVPSIAGLISGSLWLVFLAVPLVLSNTLQYWVHQEQYGKALIRSHIVRWLHPLDGWVEYPPLLRALQLGQAGQFDEAIEILSRYQNPNMPAGRAAPAHIYRLRSDWQGLVHWAEGHVAQSLLIDDSSLSSLYLRSLGETGDLPRLLQTFEQLEQRLAKHNDPLTLNWARLYVLAFSGQVAQLQLLLNQVFSKLPEPVREFWLLTAERAAKVRSIDHQLQTLSDRNPGLQRAIDWRLKQNTLPINTVLTDAHYRIFDRLETSLQQEARYGIRLGGVKSNRKAIATCTLMALNMLVFAAELYLIYAPIVPINITVPEVGSVPLEALDAAQRSDFALVVLGGMVPAYVFEGEWWRLLTATFLHSGMLHLGANMLGLSFFGPSVEAMLGRLKFSLAYLFCGVGSMLAVALMSIPLTVLNPNAQSVLCVGASGAIMGLLGMTAAMLLKGWRTEGAIAAKRQLRVIVLLLALQAFSDLLTPQVSFLGHFFGTVLGFLIGSVLFQPARSTQRLR